MKVGLDLTEIKIKKFDQFQVIQESISFDIDKVKEASKNIGLDLTNEKQNDRIDSSKYKDINESRSQEELKKSAETIGLDLTKNLPKRIDLI